MKCPVASCQACRTSGLRASPAATRPFERGALGDHAVLGGGHAEDVDAFVFDDLEPLVRVEAGVVQERGGLA
jgi:hypothetical protein